MIEKNRYALVEKSIIELSVIIQRLMVYFIKLYSCKLLDYEFTFMSKELTPKELKALKKAQKQAQRAARKENDATADISNMEVSQKPVVELELFDVEAVKPVRATANTHPAVLKLALRMQACKVLGSSLRCREMLQAFTEVIRDYCTPEGSTLNRSLAAHFSHQIEVLKMGRSLGVAMGNAIRWLKQQTSEVPSDMPDSDAKDLLIDLIQNFMRDRLEMADTIIVEHGSQHIRDKGDVILVYGGSHVVHQTLAHAHTHQHKNFRVVVADSPPLFEGRRLGGFLASLGIPVTYVLVTALPYVLREVTVVMVGAHSMVSNGHLYSRAGTSLVSSLAQHRSIPVLVLCETIKFSDRVLLDAFGVNEAIPGHPGCVFYDLTDQCYISKVITELGALPASSVPVILREYRQLL